MKMYFVVTNSSRERFLLFVQTSVVWSKGFFMNSINCVIYLYNSQYIWDKLKFVEERTTGEVQFRILRSFLVVLTEFSFWGGGLSTGP